MIIYQISPSHLGANATDFVRWILDNLSTFIPIKVDKLSNLFKGNRYKMEIIVGARSAPKKWYIKPVLWAREARPIFWRGLALYIRRAKRARKILGIFDQDFLKIIRPPNSRLFWKLKIIRPPIRDFLEIRDFGS